MVNLCLCINSEIEKKLTISECLLIGGETENLSWTQKPPTRFVIETFQLITLAVCCGYVSNLACSRRSGSAARAKKKASERAGKNEGRLGKRTRERL